MPVGYGTVLVKYSHTVVERIRLERGGRTQIRVGVLVHDEVAQREYGENIGIGRGEIVVVPMCAKRWIESVRFRTQILYGADVAMILYMAEIRAGQTVVESGTGSLGLTYALSKTVGERGKVFTFEVDRERCEAASKEIGESMDNVEIAERDVVAHGFGMEGPVDGVILDLPTPQHVVREAERVLSDEGVFVVFVPCIEQVQSVLKVLAERETFETPRMFEILEIPHKMKSLKMGEERVYGTAPASMMRGHTGYIVLTRKGQGLYY
jgi:tRNA (adenine57-N1/adenine58-N1)-methyltransferase catalytic subunit